MQMGRSSAEYGAWFAATGFAYLIGNLCCVRFAPRHSLEKLIWFGLALQLFGADKIALATAGVREVSPQEQPELHAMIERLCVQADLPKPKVAVADTRMPNAFALRLSQIATRRAILLNTASIASVAPAQNSPTQSP